MKQSLARVDPVSTYIFDEVDAGVGGAIAESMGCVLAQVSREGQVIAVTHLPQIAAFADQHLRVEKRVQGGRTSAGVARLESDQDRRGEVARMLAGATITASAFDHAAALIAAAQVTSRMRVSRGLRAAPPSASG